MSLPRTLRVAGLDGVEAPFREPVRYATERQTATMPSVGRRGVSPSSRIA